MRLLTLIPPCCTAFSSSKNEEPMVQERVVRTGPTRFAAGGGIQMPGVPKNAGVFGNAVLFAEPDTIIEPFVSYSHGMMGAAPRNDILSFQSEKSSMMTAAPEQPQFAFRNQMQITAPKPKPISKVEAKPNSKPPLSNTTKSNYHVTTLYNADTPLLQEIKRQLLDDSDTYIKPPTATKKIQPPVHEKHFYSILGYETTSPITIFEENLSPAPKSDLHHSNQPSTASACNAFTDKHQTNDIRSQAEIFIAIISTKQITELNSTLHFPFLIKQMNKLPSGQRNTALAYFTGGNQTNMPTFSENGNSDHDGRYMKVLNYISNCWQGDNLKWLFVIGDDAVVSPVRLQSFSYMLEGRYGSPTERPFLFGKRAPWSVFDKKFGHENFGGNGMLFSKGLLNVLKSNMSQETWNNVTDASPTSYESRLTTMLQNNDLNTIIYRGPFTDRPFGMSSSPCDFYSEMQNVRYSNSTYESLVVKHGKESVKTVVSLHKVVSAREFKLAEQIFGTTPIVEDYLNLNYCDMLECSDCIGLDSQNPAKSCSARNLYDKVCYQSLEHTFTIDFTALLLLTISIVVRFIRENNATAWMVGLAYSIGLIAVVCREADIRLHTMVDNARIVPLDVNARSLALLWIPVLGFLVAMLVSRRKGLVESDVMVRGLHWLVIGLCMGLFLFVSLKERTADGKRLEFCVNVLVLCASIVGYVSLFYVYYSPQLPEQKIVEEEVTPEVEDSSVSNGKGPGRVRRLFRKIFSRRNSEVTNSQ